MTDHVHDDEADMSAAVVAALLAEQCPQWADLTLSYLATSGTTNAMWRVENPQGTDVVVRLPRTRGAVASIEQELKLLPRLTDVWAHSNIATPNVAYAGQPSASFEHPWMALDWIDGTDGWAGRNDLEPNLDALAEDLATVVLSLRGLNGLPAPSRKPGERGGPLDRLLNTLDWWLSDPQWEAAEMLDVPAIRRSAAESAEAAAEPFDHCFLHGDLIPGNLLTSAGRLSAVIDWGSAGYGDPAQDLTPAWAVFKGTSREIFSERVHASEAMWLRARAIELEHTVGGILYYRPRGHPLADVMERTLRRILAAP